MLSSAHHTTCQMNLSACIRGSMAPSGRPSACPRGRVQLPPSQRLQGAPKLLPGVSQRASRSGNRPFVVTAAAAGDAPEGGPKQSTVFNVPTILTMVRVVAVPVLVAGFYWSSPASAPLCTILFIAAAITDFLDGYLARKWDIVSAFGAFLDPVADKLMVAAVLVLLGTQPIVAGPLAGDKLLVPLSALAIIGREITMSALREWAAAMGGEAHKAVAVNNLGKWKTATQMVSLSMLLYVKDGASDVLGSLSASAGPVLLIVAAALTVWSLVVYMKALWPYLSA